MEFDVSEIKEGSEVIEELGERLTGRYTAEDIVNPKQTVNCCSKKYEYMDSYS